MHHGHKKPKKIICPKRCCSLPGCRGDGHGGDETRIPVVLCFQKGSGIDPVAGYDNM